MAKKKPEAADDLAPEEIAARLDELVEEIAEEVGVDDDNPDLTVLRAFGSPQEWRTMANVIPEVSHRAAGVYAKGVFLGSTIRMEFAKSLFLMSRSKNGWGSGQMAGIVTKTPSDGVGGAMKRFFSIGRRKDDMGGG